jgi:hypothetical protein
VSGDQLQIDFGEKGVRVGGNEVRVFLFVGVLSYSRPPAFDSIYAH